MRRKEGAIVDSGIQSSRVHEDDDDECDEK
jgi:hypothetical protein